MWFLRAVSLFALLVRGTTVLENQYPQSCAPDQCAVKTGREPFSNGQTCCPQTDKYDGHICGPDLPCCGNGCCPQGWTCGQDDTCYPLQTLTEGPDVTIVTTITVTSCLPLTSTTITTANQSGESTTVILTISQTTTAQATTVVTTNSAGQPTTIVVTPDQPATSTVVTTNSGGQPTTIIVTPDQSSTQTIVTTNSDGQPTTIIVTPEQSSTRTIATTNSDGQSTTIIATSDQSATSTIVTTNSDGQPTTIIVTPDQPTTSTIVTTNSNGQPTTIIVTPDKPTTQTIVTTNSDGQPTTVIALPDQSTTRTIVTTNSEGQATTIILPPGQTTSTPPITTSVVTTNSLGQPTTVFVPPGQTPSTVTFAPTLTTGSDGQLSTIFPVPCRDASDGLIPYEGIGLDGKTTTFFPLFCSDSSSAGSPQSTTSIITTRPDGVSTTVFIPPGQTPSSVTFLPTTTTLPGGQIETVFPVPCRGIFDDLIPYVGVGLDGVQTTFFPLFCSDTSSASSTLFTTSIITTKPDGASTTVFIPPGQTPSAVTLPQTTTTLPDGQVTSIWPVPCRNIDDFLIPYEGTGPDGKTTIFYPFFCPTQTASSSTTNAFNFLIPVTTTVDAPKPTDTGVVIPCKIWFFNICIVWGEIHIGGWQVIQPPGIYPPGPPPPIKIDGSDNFKIDIKGTLPEWPEYTIGVDYQPTFGPEPTECETESAEMCIESTSYGVSVSNTETTTTTTQTTSTCATVYGCKIEGSTSSATTTATETGTSTPVAHVVYPMEGRNETQVAFIEGKLSGIVKDPSDFAASKYDDFGVLFWRSNISFEDAAELRKLSDIASITEACGDDANPCYDPTTSLTYQGQAPDQLTYVSWPNTNPRTPMADLHNAYYFDDSFGEDIPTYIFDTGANMENPEFDLIRDKAEYIMPLPDFDGASRKDDSYISLGGNDMFTGPHGTAMLSLVAGKTLGVAKKIKPYIVRLPRSRPAPGGGFSPEAYLETWASLANQMPASTDGKTAGIVCIAQDYIRGAFALKLVLEKQQEHQIDIPNIDQSMGFEIRLHFILEQIIEKGYFLITGTDNLDRSYVDGWPANFGDANNRFYKPSLLVVGALSAAEPDDASAFSKGSVDVAKGLPHVYAPGFLVTAADGNSLNWNPLRRGGGYTKPSTGVSCATSMTSGLAATFLKLIQLGQLKNDDGSLVANTPQAIKDYIIAKSWSRGKLRGPGEATVDRNGIWNGFDATKLGSCKWDPDGATKLRRQNSGQCQLPLSSTASFTTSTTTSKITTSVGPTTTTKTAAPTTTAPPAPTKTVTPLALSNPTCNNEKDYPGHIDTSGSEVDATAFLFCTVDMEDLTTMGPNDSPFSDSELGTSEARYKFTVSWVPGCETTVDKQDVLRPIGSDKAPCWDILYSTWKNCDNGGVGGYVDAGCLRYYLQAGI